MYNTRVRNQMYKRFLLKQNFWVSRRKNEVWFVKHTAESGGIYARLLDSKGVEIIHNGKKKVFTDFNELEDYLNRITAGPDKVMENEFISILNRKVTAKVLRSSLPI